MLSYCVVIKIDYLEMMSGRDEENISADMLTMDELRIIALYLSNFYIPFGTSLDGAESRDTSKENCKTALINLGFEKDLAEEIVEMVMAASLSSASQLYMDIDAVADYCGYIDYPIGPDGVSYVREPKKAEYIVFDDWGLGGDSNFYPSVPIYKGVGEPYLTRLNSSWVLEYAYARYTHADKEDASPTVNFVISDYDYDPISGVPTPLTLWGWDALTYKGTHMYDSSGYAYDTDDHIDNPFTVPVYYMNEGNKVNVFEFSKETSSLWNAIMRNADYSNGKAGNAYYNDTSIHNALNSSDDEILARTIFTQPMYVDWVGNIICDCGDERIVVLPACINPYVFSANKGVQFDDRGVALYNNPEYNFNAVSTFGMSILQDERLFRVSEGNFTNVDDMLDLNTYSIKQTRGSRKDANWDDIVGSHGSNDDGAKLLKELLGSSGMCIVVPESGWEDAMINKWACNTGYRWLWSEQIVDFSSKDSVGNYINTTCDIAYFNSEVSRVVTTNSFNTVSVFDLLAGNGETKISPFSDTGKFNTITGNSYHNFINFTSPVDLRLLKSIFVTYTFAYCNAFPPARADAEFSGFTVNMTFNDIFPKVEGYLQFNHNFEERQSNERAEQTLGMIYWLLHPVKGIGYASTLFKRKIGGILVSWHEDIVGATSSNYTTGSTHYLGSSLMMHIKPHR